MKTKILKQINNAKMNSSNNKKDSIYKYFLYGITLVISVIVLFSLLFTVVNGIKTITDNDLSIVEILFGDKYTPAQGIVGMGFIVFNTLWMSFLVILVATPVAIGTSLIITRTLGKRSSAFMYSVVAILAAIPSVIYGSFGYYIIDDFSTGILGFQEASLFTIVIMLSFMVMPTITIMTITSIKLTDKKIEESSYALGANKTQTSIYITLRAAKSGIITGIIFAISRCLAEATAITMVGSSGSFLGGITIPLWKQSLFLAPALLSAATLDTHSAFPVMPLIAMFLILTTTIIFGLMKFYEFKSLDANISKKESKILKRENDALRKLETEGMSSLSYEENRYLISLDRKRQISDRQNAFFERPEIALRSILQKSSISSTIKYESYKKSKSKKHNFLIYSFSLFGILLLTSIMVFLFNGGFEYLNWNTLTFRGSTKVDDKVLYGLSVPMLGTLFTIILSLIISLPIGVLLGICLSTYLNKNSKIGQFTSFVFQLLTSIPTIVWSTIAIVIFAGTNLHNNIRTLEPILFLSIIILPTIIKQTEQAGKRIDKNKIEGSYALGATVAITTRRIYLKEAFGSIIAGALLAVSIAMAESTIFISILPSSPVPPETIGEWWNSSGATTLSTAIYKLKNSYPINDHPEVLLQIKTIGIILMMTIITISYSSVLITDKKYIQSLMLIGMIVLLPFGFYINHGSIAIISIALILGILGYIILPVGEWINLKWMKGIRI